MTRYTSILLLTTLLSCSDKIEITSDFITNQYWDDYNSNITIMKLMITKGDIDITSENFKTNYHVELLSKLSIDSTNIYSKQSANRYLNQNDTVYFDRYNGWYWNNNKSKTETIGQLEKKVWYRFSNLKMNTKYNIYVYVDSLGTTHNYVVNNANF